MVEWLIIGGGIQGMTLATYLRKKKGVPLSNIMIVDPHTSPLSMWKQCTSNIGMPYLRSPSIHHLDPSPFALEKFAASINSKKKTMFIAPYDRPALPLFNEHCTRLVEELNLMKSWNCGRVCHISRDKNNWRVFLEDGQIIDAHHVVLAIGLSEQLNYPVWATELKNLGADVHHVFEKDLASFFKMNKKKTLIIGGGISAAHSALATCEKIPGNVTLLSRHPLRVQQFDSNPSWLGPKKMRTFLSTHSYSKRRELIKNARHRGSMPSELKVRLHQALTNEKLEIVHTSVIEATYDQHTITVRGTNGFEWVGESILLASGFQQSIPGINWLKQLIKTERLPCAICGYPTPDDQTLEWGPNLHVLGALAELSIGPVSRNISGARRGSERIISS
jgi:thioredoxin reductase